VTVAYVESSALVKLAVRELETLELRAALASHEHVVSSALSTVEVTRVAWRANGEPGIVRARAALLNVNTIPIDWRTIDASSRLAPPSLRSLDAIHVATALGFVEDGVVFYSYDRRALEAARTAGLAVKSPGAPS
jgi:predicted nucleic acid-binding protein